jgi:hypothetical protein
MLHDVSLVAPVVLNLVTNLVISREWGADREVFTSSGTVVCLKQSTAVSTFINLLNKKDIYYIFTLVNKR